MQVEPSSTERSTRNRARFVLVGLFVLFFIPVFGAVIIAAVAPHWVPFGSINHGELVQPPVADVLRELRVLDDAGPRVDDDRESWTIAHVSDGQCEARCEYAFLQMRQARLALGKDAHRVERWWFVTRQPDVQLLERITGAWPGMRIGKVDADSALAAYVASATSVVMVDPAGFLVMWYPDDPTGGESSGESNTLATALRKDFKRLLKISKRS